VLALQIIYMTVIRVAETNVPIAELKNQAAILKLSIGVTVVEGAAPKVLESEAAINWHLQPLHYQGLAKVSAQDKHIKN